MFFPTSTSAISIESISNKIENCEIIFDSNYITFNDIISSIQTLSNNKNLIYSELQGLVQQF